MKNVKHFQQKGRGIQQIAASADQVNQIRQQIIETQFNILFPAKLKAGIFPSEKLTCTWKSNAANAWRYTAALRLGLTQEEYHLIYTKLTGETDEPINLDEFSLVSNNLESRTPQELELGMDDYNKAMLEANEMSKAWGDITGPMRTELENYIKSQIQVKQANPLQPIGKFNGKPEAEEKPQDHGVLEVDLEKGTSKEIGSTTEAANADNTTKQ